MGFLSNIFGKKPYKMETIDDYKEYNQVPVNFTKLYYKFPDERVKFEGESKEYYSFDDFVVDFPHLYLYEYPLKKSKHIIVNSGYFFQYRGNLYGGKNVQDCLNKKVGYYKKDNPTNQTLQSEMELVHKSQFKTLFSNTPCLVLELGDDIRVNILSLKHKGIISAKTTSVGNRFSTISIGNIYNKPIMFGDKVLILNVQDYHYKKYLPDEYKEHDVPLFPEVFYGCYIKYENGDGSYRDIFNSPDKLLRKENVVVDFLRYEDIDMNKYLDSFTTQSRKRKLKRLREISK